MLQPYFAYWEMLYVNGSLHYDKQINSQAKAHQTVSYVIKTDDLRVSNSFEPEFLFPKFQFSF